jgi:dynein heavy chain
MIENLLESIDAILTPVVSRAAAKRGNKRYIKIGDDEVEMHADFRFFLHTKLSNPHYPPEIQAECALVNFTVTESGLEEQLLNMVVKMERPDLAEERLRLIDQQNGFKIQMAQLEDDILHKLATAEGDITQDRELIEGLVSEASCFFFSSIFFSSISSLLLSCLLSQFSHLSFWSFNFFLTRKIPKQYRMKLK